MKLSRTPAIAIAALSLIAVGGIAGATIPSSTGVITACSVPPAGTVRVIDAEAGQTCKKGEQTITWNQQGQAGTNGTNGTNGAAGAAGISGYEVFPARDTVLVGPSTVLGKDRTEIAKNAICPSGKKILGGVATGYIEIFNPNGAPFLRALIAAETQFFGDDTLVVGFVKNGGATFDEGDRLRTTLQITCANVTTTP